MVETHTRTRGERHIGLLGLSLIHAFAMVTLLTFAPSQAAAENQTSALLEQLTWRNVGPDRGGRSIAAAGSSQRPNEAFFGATGGGLWKTQDAGHTWRPVTDGEIGSSSVGAIAVAPSNPDIVYLGMGEGQLRNNVMQGDGVYRSDDGGESWRHIGLKNTRTITTIRVHPDDPNTVYVAALGDPYQPSRARGIYRSRDGGETWKKVLYTSAEAGAIDLSMDPSNPDRMFATLWQVYRKPWKLWSGGPNSGLFESLDGGETWAEITDRPGLPARPLGKMTVAISPADPDRVYANIEAKEGGLYRSDDGGQTWQYVNGARKLWQRSFYFMQVRPDPVDRDKVYVLSFQLERSTNGGESFTAIPTQHVDIHDLWIDPENPDRMVVADDGGGSVTLNGGKTWTEQDYPTAQMYRVTTTNDFPYHICGSQQDNTTICVSSRTFYRPPFFQERYSGFYTIGGSEMGYVAVHPEEEGVFFVGATNSLARYDRETNQRSEVTPYPYFVMGQASETMEDRWNWTYPIVFSAAEGNRLYAGSQRLWQSDDQGLNWKPISEDLTRADPDTLGPTGGLILLDQDGPEVYGTLFTIAPSRFDGDVIWTGSDDGLVHVTRNGGASWGNVTPRSIPKHSRISFIDASHHDAGTAYVAVKRYEMGDRRPYLYRITDYGRRWERLDRDLPKDEFVHTVREDPEQPGLLYIGTEHGVWVSFNDGRSWQELSLNLPDVHVSGLEVKGNDLVAATHGRSFYILEGLELVRQLSDGMSNTKPTLLGGGPAMRRLMPATLFLTTPRDLEKARLDILNADEDIIRTLFKDRSLTAGAHRFNWNLHHQGAEVFPGMILESPSPATGPLAVPGRYTAALKTGDETYSMTFDVAPDPRLEGIVTQVDFENQLTLALRARNAASRANEMVIEIRKLKADLADSCGAAGPKNCTQTITDLSEIEAALYQVKNESPKDKIAYPIQLNDRLAGVLSTFVSSDGPPTKGQETVLERLEADLNVLDERFVHIKGTVTP